ncbi:baeRF2 domain-containing protein [Naasia lichenicola]|uniref:Peptide chain release factor 1 n=1 Tax=Naasia lichenicola TaxID=2565933 RepID=A0A4V3WTR7_9MICO|nr:Vms1/Ankzf1 family peptidyl-tRNA hydrolase [Naasia lichenicola]THG32997.1 hypothetical protein E6C64_01110 [Naasia lichenicola]
MSQGPNSHADTLDRQLIDTLRQGGWWITIYTDASMDSPDPRGVQEARHRAILDRLHERDVPAEHLQAIADALAGTEGVPSPAGRYLLTCEGRIVHNQVLPGALVGPEVVDAGPIPLLVPLLRHRGDEICYLVVEAGREGGEVSVFSSASAEPQTSDNVQGRDDTLKKFQGAGWSHLRYQRHTEAIWKQTESELAAVVDRLADEHRPRLIVVAGDVHARRFLVEQLSSASQQLVAQLDANTRADGASSATLDEFVDRELRKLTESDRRRDLDRLATELGKEDGAGESGVGWTVHALRQAQVEILLVDPDALEGRTLLALDAEPWIATAPEDATSAKILGSVPAAEALVRAAALTDAAVRISRLESETAGAAGLLRWPAAAPTGG